MNFKGIDTIAVQAGQPVDCASNSRAVPIYQTTAYAFNSAAHAADLFQLKTLGNIYTRLNNPTNDILDRRVAAIHGGTQALCVASGMSAIFYAVTAITSAGQNIVASSCLYGGTVTLFTQTLKRFGIEARLCSTENLAELEKRIDDKTRLLYCETIGNPACNVEDLEALAEIAHRHGIPLVVDDTVSPPPMGNPFNHGADILVCSLTKIIGGHGTSLGGAIIENGKFNWANGKFPELAGPDPAYHDFNFWQAFGNHKDAAIFGASFCFKIRCGLLRDTGAAISPFNSQQLLLGTETLPLRTRKHLENAQIMAEWLAAHPLVAWVNYPGLPGNKFKKLAEKYYPLGPGAIMGFAPKGGFEASKKLVESVKMITHLVNLLDAKSLVTHPASTTHQQLSASELVAAGVTDDFIRLSVGIEDVADIQADLDQALKASALV